MASIRTSLVALSVVFVAAAWVAASEQRAGKPAVPPPVAHVTHGEQHPTPPPPPAKPSKPSTPANTSHPAGSPTTPPAPTKPAKPETEKPDTDRPEAAKPPAAVVPANPAIVAKLQALLPPGTTITAAAQGFKNQGQFIAAVHVANNLGISFTDLRTDIVDNHMSLGQAIQALKPGVDAEAQVDKAQLQTKADLTAAKAAPGRDGDGDRDDRVAPRVSPVLLKNTALVARLQVLLPAGTTVTAAATGFRDNVQFIAAVHAASNLGIGFADLKADIVTQHMSLGDAIHALKPGVNAAAAVKTADTQAQTDLLAVKADHDGKGLGLGA